MEMPSPPSAHPQTANSRLLDENDTNAEVDQVEHSERVVMTPMDVPADCERERGTSHQAGHQSKPAHHPLPLGKPTAWA